MPFQLVPKSSTFDDLELLQVQILLFYICENAQRVTFLVLLFVAKIPTVKTNDLQKKDTDNHLTYNSCIQR